MHISVSLAPVRKKYLQIILLFCPFCYTLPTHTHRGFIFWDVIVFIFVWLQVLPNLANTERSGMSCIILKMLLTKKNRMNTPTLFTIISQKLTTAYILPFKMRSSISVTQDVFMLLKDISQSYPDWQQYNFLCLMDNLVNVKCFISMLSENNVIT